MSHFAIQKRGDFKGFLIFWARARKYGQGNDQPTMFYPGNNPKILLTLNKRSRGN